MPLTPLSFFTSRFRSIRTATQRAQSAWWNPNAPYTGWQRSRLAYRSLQRWRTASDQISSDFREDASPFIRPDADFSGFSSEHPGTFLGSFRDNLVFHRLPRHMDATRIDNKDLAESVLQIDKKVVTSFNQLIDSLGYINRDVSKKLQSQNTNIRRISSELTTVLIEQRKIHHELNRLNFERQNRGEQQNSIPRPDGIREDEQDRGSGWLSMLLGGALQVGAGALAWRALSRLGGRFGIGRTPLGLGIAAGGLAAYGAYQYFRNPQQDNVISQQNPNVEIETLNINAKRRFNVETEHAYFDFQNLTLTPRTVLAFRRYLNEILRDNSELRRPDPRGPGFQLWPHRQRLESDDRIPRLVPSLETPTPPETNPPERRREDFDPNRFLTTPEMLRPPRRRGAPERVTPRTTEETPTPVQPPPRELFSELPSHLRFRTTTPNLEELERLIRSPLEGTQPPRRETETPPNAPPTGTGRYTRQPSDSNVDYLMRRLMAEGLTRQQAAGVVGNLQAETGERINLGVVGDSGTAFGLAQWRGDRWTALQRFARERRLNPNSLETQTDFMIHEARQRGDWARIRSATTAAEAAAIWDRHYERSSGAHRGRRIENAEALAERDYQVPDEQPRPRIADSIIESNIPGVTLQDTRGIFDSTRISGPDIATTTPMTPSPEISRRIERREPTTTNLGPLPLEEQRERPRQYTGNLNFQGESFRFGTGGRGYSTPYGTFELTPGANGPIVRRLGGYTFSGNQVYDPLLGRYRGGVALHRSGSDRNLVSAGCIAIAASDWPRLRQLIETARAQGQRLAVRIKPDGQAELIDLNNPANRGTIPADRAEEATRRIDNPAITQYPEHNETLEQRYERETGRQTRAGNIETEEFTRWRDEQSTIPGITLDRTRPPDFLNPPTINPPGVQMENPVSPNLIAGITPPITMLNPNLMSPDTILPEIPVEQSRIEAPPRRGPNEIAADDYTPYETDMPERETIISPTHNPESERSRITSGYGDEAPNNFEQE